MLLPTGSLDQPLPPAKDTWYTLKVSREIVNLDQIEFIPDWYLEGGTTPLHEETASLPSEVSDTYLAASITVVSSGFYGSNFEVTVTSLQSPETYRITRGTDLIVFPVVVDTEADPATTFIDMSPRRAFYGFRSNNPPPYPMIPRFTEIGDDARDG